jgi:hypothetical protein
VPNGRRCVAANDELELVFDTVDNSRKFRNVQRDGRVAVVFCAAGGYKSGSHDERTVQHEGRAGIPSGEELRRVQEEIYFKQFPDRRARLKWEHITYVHVRPTWIRYSNYNEGPPELVEWSGDALAKLVAKVGIFVVRHRLPMMKGCAEAFDSLQDVTALAAQMNGLGLSVSI